MSEKDTVRHPVNLTEMEEKELLEWIGIKWENNYCPRDRQAYNQLREIVKEHFHLKSMNLEEAQRWVEKDIQKMREQQKVKVSRDKLSQILKESMEIMQDTDGWQDAVNYAIERIQKIGVEMGE